MAEASDSNAAAGRREAAVFPALGDALPYRVVRRGDTVRPLPPHGRSLAELTFDAGGVSIGLGDYMARRRTAGLLILKDGEIALERYGLCHGPEALWTSFSAAKSITATLCSAALHDGAVGSTIAATSTCRGCAARPTSASLSAMSCGCARV
jgi:CubicO group peptidase (beta-lactamase class C family)